GAIGEALLTLVAERGGLVTQRDLGSYEARWSEPGEGTYAGTRLLTSGVLWNVPETIASLPTLHGLSEGERAVALAHVLDDRPPDGHTTNLSVGGAAGKRSV